MEFTEATRQLISDGVLEFIGEEEQDNKYKIFKFKVCGNSLFVKGTHKEILNYEEIYLLDDTFVEYVLYYKWYQVIRDQNYIKENVKIRSFDDY